MNVSMGTKQGLALAQLGLMLQYPRTGFAQKIETLSSSVASAYAKSARDLAQFTDACNKKSLTEFEEIYTRTFDLAAICSPYVTGYIYGDENYDRGTLMATLSEKYKELDFEAAGELPDHLSLLLQFCSLLDQEALDELISFCLLKPVSEMSDRLKDSENPYRFLIAAIFSVLEADSGGERHD